jgi:beta-lactamase class A
MEYNGIRMTRRRAIGGILAAASFSYGKIWAAQAKDFGLGFDAIETRSGGRLGCAVLDTATGRRMGHRESERFPMCSTFKLAAAGLVLRRVDQGEERLDRRVVFSANEIVTYSPVTGGRAGGEGMTMAELCEAALTQSDNTAGNLLLKSFGGPEGLNIFLRSIGDTVTRLDRTETTLNEATPGDPRDTTTPEAMLENLHRLVVGSVLSSASRERLTRWLVANKTGDARVRAGLPKDWEVGDKTGSGDHGTTNDIACVWPRDRAPVLVTVYLTESTLESDGRNTIVADVARLVAGSVT